MQDLDTAECPGCGAHASLSLEHSYPTARTCGSCDGWFLERDTAYRFVVEELGFSADHLAGLLATPGPRQRRCPACAGGMSEIILHRDDVDMCSSCGGVWLPPGVMERLSRGAYGAKTPAPSFTATAAPSPFGPPPGERPANPFGPPPSTTPPPAQTAPPVAPPVAAVAAQPAAPPAAPPAAAAPAPAGPELPSTTTPLTSGPNAAARPQLRLGKPVPRGTASTPRESVPPRGTGSADGGRGKLVVAAAALLLLVGVGGGIALLLGGDDEEAPAAEAPQGPTEKYAAYLRHYRFGGRNLDWWSARLTELAPGGTAPDAALYAITKARAEKLGLVVTEGAGSVDVALSAPLVARLLERLEVR